MKKRSAVTAIIVLFICVAVYINWNTENIESDAGRILKNRPDVQTSAENEVQTNEDGENLPGNEEKDVKGDVSEYFDEARMEKQKARDSAITTLKEAVNEENLSQTSRDNAAASIETISTGAISETRIETLVKAKGYTDCIALINKEGVNVIVTAPAEGLSASDTTKIKDIAVGETDFLPSQIKIIEIK
ncbi:MAG: SpoIIIAH-like family protein [Oscillospiraceae bacterium]|nr:SpoIIIAH-like family protein [Oscillospiraceae bacterium]